MNQRVVATNRRFNLQHQLHLATHRPLVQENASPLFFKVRLGETFRWRLI